MVVKRFFALFIILSAVNLYAQKSFTLDDVVPGGKNMYKFYPRQAYGNFTLDGEYYMQTSADTFYVLNGVSKIPHTNLAAITNVVASHVKKSPGRVIPVSWLSSTQLWVRSDNSFFKVNLKSKSVDNEIALHQKASGIDLMPLQSAAAYVVDNNLYVSLAGKDAIKVAGDDIPGHVYGKTVHRDEFGINKGTFWSPNASKLAFYFMDESMVNDYPIVDISTRIATPKPVKYPMAGLESHHVQVGVYDVKSDKTIYLKTGAPVDRFFTNIAWTPDEKHILVAEINRGQDHMKLNMYDAVSGEFVKTMFEESDEKWVEPSNPPFFLSKNKEQFVWQSKRDGYNHLYLYDLQGKLVKQLTKGNWNVTQFYGFDSSEKNLYIQSTAQGYLERHIYSVSVKSGDMKQLSKGAGTHRAVFSSNKTMWMDNYTSMDVPARSTLTNTTKGTGYVVVDSKNPYTEYNMPLIKMVDIKSADSRYTLTGRVILPVDFDASKKYPVFVYVYGGPHSQMVTNSWLGGAQTWFLMLAQKGYIVFTMDNRGTDGHGKEFEQAIHRQLGECEMADQMEGIKYLKTLPYVDADRIGVNGWSYGGFMTTSLMLRHNDVFKVGVAGGPVIDWKMYEIMYGERYMDHPDDNVEGYKQNNLCNYVTDLKGRLMLIHGDEDPVVVMQHSLRFLQEAVKNRVQVDYFVYPGHEHNVLGADRVHLIDKIIRYFDDFL